MKHILFSFLTIILVTAGHAQSDSVITVTSKKRESSKEFKLKIIDTEWNDDKLYMYMGAAPIACNREVSGLGADFNMYKSFFAGRLRFIPTAKNAGYRGALSKYPDFVSIHKLRMMSATGTINIFAHDFHHRTVSKIGSEQGGGIAKVYRLVGKYPARLKLGLNLGVDYRSATVRESPLKINDSLIIRNTSINTGFGKLGLNIAFFQDIKYLFLSDNSKSKDTDRKWFNYRRLIGKRRIYQLSFNYIRRLHLEKEYYQLDPLTYDLTPVQYDAYQLDKMVSNNNGWEIRFDVMQDFALNIPLYWGLSYGFGRWPISEYNGTYVMDLQGSILSVGLYYGFRSKG